MNSTRVRALVLFFAGILTAPAHADTTVWAATQDGVYKSVDSGATWERVPVNVDSPLLQGSDPQTADVSALALDPQKRSTIYFTGVNRGSSGIGFYRSTDNGKTWTSTVLIGYPVTVPISFQTAWILVDPVMTNVIFLGWSGGVARSTDYGKSFTTLTLPVRPNSGGFTVVPDGLSLDPTTTGVIYLSSLASVWRSTDYGDTWSQLGTVEPNPHSVNLGDVAVDPKNNNLLMLGTATSGSPFCGPNNAEKICGLWRSVDRGQTWTSVGPTGQYYQIAYDARSRDQYVSAGLLGLGNSVLKSTDTGSTWTPVSNKTADFLIADPDVSGTLYGYLYNTNAWAKSTDGGATFKTDNYIVITGNFRDIHQLVVPKTVGFVSAASFRSGPVTPESIVSAFGYRLATGVVQNSSSPLPTSLGGTTVNVVDSTGTSRLAPLFYVSPGQVNYEIPAATAAGVATVTIQSGDGTVSTAPLGIGAVSPGLFELNAAHLAAANALRVSGASQTYENVYQLDASNNVIPRPIDLGPAGDQIFLLLYGTGLRAAKTTTATVGGVNVPVLFAGPQGQFAGEDQVNIGPLPQSLAGRGSVAIVLSSDGVAAQSVNVTIK